MNTQIDNILHRDELNRQLGELKACRDGLLLDYIKGANPLSYWAAPTKVIVPSELN